MMTQRPLARALPTGALLMFAVPSAARAASGGMEPGEAALFFTATLTLLLVAILFFVLVVPEDDRRRIGEALSRVRAYLVPTPKERVTEFDHDFDGIRELDNRIPPWFTYLFLGTVVFGAGYLLDYHVLHSSKLMAEEYQEEVAVAEIQRRIALASEGQIDETALVALTDPVALKRAGDNFAKFCASCHGARAEGGIGPNLTDDFWIHGGGIGDVYRTIKQGVPAKGMISWQLVFTPKQIQELGSFVVSLRGSNPPNAKRPEGDRYVSADSSRAAL